MSKTLCVPRERPHLISAHHSFDENFMIQEGWAAIAVNRRQLIGRSAALVTSFVVGRHFARAADGYPFTLGVASGEPTQDGFVLWTRLAPVPLALDGLGGTLDPVQPSRAESSCRRF
jgi:hypothetical protein